MVELGNTKRADRFCVCCRRLLVGTPGLILAEREYKEGNLKAGDMEFKENVSGVSPVVEPTLDVLVRWTHATVCCG